MSGHSKWATIKHKKGAADAKRGKLFAKLIKQVEVAARQGGGDPDANPTLRTMFQKARDNSVPLDTIERAVKRGTGELEGVNYETVTYEGYAPGGIALLIECLTDNRNRTSGDVRSTLSKNGGSLAEPGAVSWQFERKGVILVLSSVEEEPHGLGRDLGRLHVSLVLVVQVRARLGRLFTRSHLRLAVALGLLDLGRALLRLGLAPLRARDFCVLLALRLRERRELLVEGLLLGLVLLDLALRRAGHAS